MRIYFGLGSNLGNRLENLREAFEKLKFFGEIIKASDVYESEAWGGIIQPNYLNACVSVENEKNLEPLEILRVIKNFEVEIGRVKNIRWGSRKIDIDILLIDNLIYKNPELNIPHINLHERMFVLVPLKNLLPPEWRHPENNKSIDEMIKALKNEEYPLRVTSLI